MIDIAICVKHHNVGDLVVVPVMLERVCRITRDVAYSFKPTVGVCIGTNNDDGTFDVFVDGTKRRFQQHSVSCVNELSSKLDHVAQVTSGATPRMFGVML